MSLPNSPRNSLDQTATRSSRQPLTELVIACAALAVLLYILRLPTARLGLVYYDDGETLYHTLSILSGQIPYRDDYSHHFLGYVLPFAAAAKVFGYSLDLVREVGFVFQLATACGVFLTARLLCGFWLSILAAAVTLSLRQPEVWGFYQQYQINLFTIFALYLSICFCLQKRTGFLCASALIAGLAFTFDQRAGALILLPLFALALEGPRRLGKPFTFCILGICFCLPGIAALIYLAAHGALLPFWEQTFIFPVQYRAASFSWLDILKTYANIHADFIRDCTAALATAFAGFTAIARDSHTWRAQEGLAAATESAWKLLLWAALPLALMPLFGARDFPYYVVTWYPYVGLLSVFCSRLFTRIPQTLQRLMQCAPLLAVVFPLVLSAMELRKTRGSIYEGDGRKEVVQFLREHMGPQDTVYVAGYRLDIYAELERLSPYPFANRLMIHADHLVREPEARRLHVYPMYEQKFLDMLRNSPPNFIVTFNRNGLSAHSSHSQDNLMSMLVSDYRMVYRIEKRDFLGISTTFEVFERTRN